MSREEKRKDLLRAAESLFLRYGYRRTTLEDLSESVGMKKSSLYHYFSGKDELFVETIRFLHASVIEKVRAAFDSDTSIRESIVKVQEILNYYVDQVSPEMGDITERMGTSFPLILKDYVNMVTVLLDIVETRFDKAVEEGELKPLPSRDVAVVLMTLFYKAVEMKKVLPEYKKVTEQPEFYINLLLKPYLV